MRLRPEDDANHPYTLHMLRLSMNIDHNVYLQLLAAHLAFENGLTAHIIMGGSCHVFSLCSSVATTTCLDCLRHLREGHIADMSCSSRMPQARCKLQRLFQPHQGRPLHSSCEH